MPSSILKKKSSIPSFVCKLAKDFHGVGYLLSFGSDSFGGQIATDGYHRCANHLATGMMPIFLWRLNT